MSVSAAVTDRAEALLSGLAQFYGTENYYRHWTRRFTYTDGIQYLAEQAGAFWLLDMVGSIQHLKKVREQSFHCYKLVVDPVNRSAVFTGDDGNGKVFYRQEIGYTDFPLDSIKLYLSNGVLMLPSEY